VASFDDVFLLVAFHCIATLLLLFLIVDNKMSIYLSMCICYSV